MSPASLQGYGEIQAAIVALLETARRAVARSINAAMTATYWEIGRRIVEFEQGGAERAAYGDALVERLAKDLTQRFGRGFSRQNLWQMRAFYRAWPAQVICQALSSKSSLFEILQTLSRESTVGTAGRRLLRETDGLFALAHTSPARGLDFVSTEDLAAALPSGNERARLVGARARDSARAHEDPSPRAGS